MSSTKLKTYLPIVERLQITMASVERNHSYQTKYLRKPLILMRALVKLFSKKEKKQSETSRCRDSLQAYCFGDGIDVGYGGDPIVPTAICMDLPQKYAAYENHVQHLHGDAANLSWFKDNSLDYVYSSHVLEDFEDTAGVLFEWLRVVKPGGHVVLYLPDEQVYRDHCKKQGKPPNAHHMHEQFGLPYLKTILQKRKDVKILHEAFPIGIYSFELVLQKTLPSNASAT